MKLDDEMRQACALALNVIPANLSPNHIAAFAAGYRMGLERAARKCEAMADAAPDSTRDFAMQDCAAAIREMAHD